jgi:phosphoglycolate phosphatase-like HAD superfamily hydrolase
VVAAFEARKLDGILDHPVFSEVVPTLMLFKSRHVARFICSSSTGEIVADYASKTNIADLIDGCFGYRPGFSKGQQIELILRQHRLDPDEVLFVSDSLMDYEFVRDNGIRFIGIRRMFEEREFQERGLCSVQDLSALIRLWDQSESLVQFVAKA